MYNGKTISLKAILWNVLNHPLANDLTYDIAAGFAIEGIKLLGTPFSYEDKVTDPPIAVTNHKALMPDNIINIRGVRFIQDVDNLDVGAIALRYASDIYHTSPNGVLSEFTYSIQNNIIYTSFDEGCIEISYKSLSVDKDGYPLIPDNQKVKLAMEYYILYRYLAPLYDIGKITDRAFNRIEKEYLFYIGAADNSMKLQGSDHMETIMNSLNKIIVNTTKHSNFFKGDGEKERLKRHN